MPAILDAALAQPICRVVLVGSSTTEGSGATSKPRRYADQLVARVALSHPAGGHEVVDSDSAEFGVLSTAAGVHGYNAGEGGTGSADYVTVTEAGRIATLGPAVVVHSIGAKDYSDDVDPAVFRANVETVTGDIDTGLTVPCLHVLVLQQERQDTGGLYPWSDYGDALADIATANPDTVVFVDASGVFAALDCFLSDPYGLGQVDDLHLTDTGHSLLAATVHRALDLTPAPRQSATTGLESADSSTFTAETVIATVSRDLRRGEQVLVECVAKVASTVAGDQVRAVLREDSLTGPALDVNTATVVSTTNARPTGIPLRGLYTADTDESKTFVVTAQQTAGSGDLRREAGSTYPQLMTVSGP